MPRFDPWAEAFCTPDPAPVTRELQAPKCRPLTITLRKLDELDDSAVLDTVAEWQALYLKGTEPLAVPAEARRKLSRAMLHNIAVVMRMEVIPEGETSYDLAGWLGIAKNQTPLWRELIKFANEVNGAPDAKN